MIGKPFISSPPLSAIAKHIAILNYPTLSNTFSVIGKPFISSPPLSAIAKLGDPVALHCEAVGDHQPKILMAVMVVMILVMGAHDL